MNRFRIDGFGQVDSQGEHGSCKKNSSQHLFLQSRYWTQKPLELYLSSSGCGNINHFLPYLYLKLGKSDLKESM